MRKRTVFMLGGLAGIVVSGAIYLSYLQVTRPRTPPTNTRVSPWGTIDAELDRSEERPELERTVRKSFRQKESRRFDKDNNLVLDYDILVLSGGGSGGAFGAGFLTGWTKSGKRPDFEIVTGVSTGSLQSTFAFLGPDYDDELTEVFTENGTEQIYTTRGTLDAVLGDAALDSAPLKELIARYIDDDVLAAVAKKYADGYKLFVGTANMDTDEFVSWDMGAIAASDRPDKLERYRDVLLASCSIPVLFPPVYFRIDVDGEACYEMHMDGGAQKQNFMRGCILDFQDALIEARMLNAKVNPTVYIIRNGLSSEQHLRHNIKPSSMSIAAAMINGVFSRSFDSSLYRMYVMTNRLGADFNLAALPDDLEPDLDPLIFDTAQMKRIYGWAHEAARTGYEWRKAPPGLHSLEVGPRAVEASRKKR